MANDKPSKLSKKQATKRYEKELRHLQIELIKQQHWSEEKGLKVVLIFEGRDAAGKGATISRESLKTSTHATVGSLPCLHLLIEKKHRGIFNAT